MKEANMSYRNYTSYLYNCQEKLEKIINKPGFLRDDYLLELFGVSPNMFGRNKQQISKTIGILFQQLVFEFVKDLLGKKRVIIPTSHMENVDLIVNKDRNNKPINTAIELKYALNSGSAFKSLKNSIDSNVVRKYDIKKKVLLYYRGDSTRVPNLKNISEVYVGEKQVDKYLYFLTGQSFKSKLFHINHHLE